MSTKVEQLVMGACETCSKGEAVELVREDPTDENPFPACSGCATVARACGYQTRAIEAEPESAWKLYDGD
jgi:MinD superfamily P-loop ATPase